VRFAANGLMTGKLDIRYRRPAPVDQPLRVWGEMLGSEMAPSMRWRGRAARRHRAGRGPRHVPAMPDSLADANRRPISGVRQLLAKLALPRSHLFAPEHEEFRGTVRRFIDRRSVLTSTSGKRRSNFPANCSRDLAALDLLA